MSCSEIMTKLKIADEFIVKKNQSKRHLKDVIGYTQQTLQKGELMQMICDKLYNYPKRNSACYSYFHEK